MSSVSPGLVESPPFLPLHQENRSGSESGDAPVHVYFFLLVQRIAGCWLSVFLGLTIVAPYILSGLVAVVPVLLLVWDSEVLGVFCPLVSVYPALCCEAPTGRGGHQPCLEQPSDPLSCFLPRAAKGLRPD